MNKLREISLWTGPLVIASMSHLSCSGCFPWVTTVVIWVCALCQTALPVVSVVVLLSFWWKVFRLLGDRYVSVTFYLERVWLGLIFSNGYSKDGSASWGCEDLISSQKCSEYVLAWNTEKSVNSCYFLYWNNVITEDSELQSFSMPSLG